ncbi:MAG TPA: DNA sulfur modification protein DndD [Candidatus Anaerostipes avicola]|nr:DNA sulfur modification protein DndD [uncultured Anaerostipes sp.]HJC82452.1 DNA sulfur modification protein DndD [Candidatus Anaerostipes avicola]
MIINQLTMHNFGVYAETNTFEFSHKKPIVLIGGMNGRGKTTFLEAILLSLYGTNSIAYKESKYRSYNQYLRSYVNKSASNQTTYVELEFVLNESSNDIYTVRREWDALTKITKETISVWQNGEYNDFLTENWAMFIENILPNALSSFYFFDGEKIAELAVDNTSNQLKESIKSMLGITILDVLKNDLSRIIRRTEKRKKGEDSNKQLENLRRERDQAVAELESIDVHISKISSEVTKMQKNIEELHKQYEQKGGKVIEQRQALMQKRAKMQTDITNNTENLIKMATSELPILLVKDLVSKIKLQAEDEHNDLIMQQALEQLDIYLEAFRKENGKSAEESQEFINFVRKKIKADEADRIYEMSDHAIFQINELLESSLQNSFDNTKVLFKQKKLLKRQLDEIDNYLTLEINEEELTRIYNQIKLKEKELIKVQVELSKLQQKRSSVNAVVITKTAEFKRDVETYLKKVELKDDVDRMLKYSNMAIDILDKYEVKLQEKKTDALGETITQCYKRLANKKNMIQKITIDPVTLELKYLDENGEEVLKDSLSAGEKQLMIIAILWALALCSKKKLPVIIDTPLSRLDSQHRTSVITTYFPNASEQIIILSTDTEIDRSYYDMIQDSIGDEFTLVYNEETKSTSIKKGYFQES